MRHPTSPPPASPQGGAAPPPRGTESRGRGGVGEGRAPLPAEPRTALALPATSGLSVASGAEGGVGVGGQLRRRQRASRLRTA